MPLAPQIPYLTSPASIVNLAIDELGEPGKIIGDLSDGSVISETGRRQYGLVLRSLLRAAHWNFARKQAHLERLGDATGNSPAPVSTYVDSPWSYAFAWPTDGLAARWMPSGPLAESVGTTSTTAPTYSPGAPLIPTRFLVSSSEQYPLLVGSSSWASMPDFQRIEGAGPTARRIILTDNCSGLFVYTRLVTTIEEWDPSFRQAMVACMKVVLAPVAIDDPRLRVAERDKAMAMAKIMVDNARVTNGQDAGYPQTLDHTPRWIRGRNWGWRGEYMNGGIGSTYCGYEGMALSGAVF